MRIDQPLLQKKNEVGILSENKIWTIKFLTTIYIYMLHQNKNKYKELEKQINNRLVILINFDVVKYISFHIYRYLLYNSEAVYIFRKLIHSIHLYG